MRNDSRTLWQVAVAIVVAGLVGCSSVESVPTADAGVADVRVTDAGDAAAPRFGLADSLVVCGTCGSDLLDAKRAGIRIAMVLVAAYAGADMVPEHAPLTFHLDNDATCGTAAEMIARYGFLTGFFFFDADAKGQICLFDVEKTNRALPFTPANAVTLPDQILPIHEAMHAWFVERVSDVAVREPFAKMVSFVVSGTIPDPCVGFRTKVAPDSLIADLCDAGLVVTDLPTILSRTAAAARQAGRALSNDELVGIVSDAIGADARPAFRGAGLL